jgi:hypothetical protein
MFAHAHLQFKFRAKFTQKMLLRSLSRTSPFVSSIYRYNSCVMFAHAHVHSQFKFSAKFYSEDVAEELIQNITLLLFYIQVSVLRIQDVYPRSGSDRFLVSRI